MNQNCVVYDPASSDEVEKKHIFILVCETEEDHCLLHTHHSVNSNSIVIPIAKLKNSRISGKSLSNILRLLKIFSKHSNRQQKLEQHRAEL